MNECIKAARFAFTPFLKEMSISSVCPLPATPTRKNPFTRNFENARRWDENTRKCHCSSSRMLATWYWSSLGDLFWKGDPRNFSSSDSRMIVDATVAALHVVLKTRVGETKIQGNIILAPPECMRRGIGAVCEIPFEKGTLGTGIFSFARMHVGVPLAALLVVALRWEESKGMSFFLFPNSRNVVLEQYGRSLLKRDPRNANSSFAQMHVGVPVAVLYCTWFGKRASVRRTY